VYRPDYLPSDAVTLELLIAAVLLWLASFIKTAKLPGGEIVCVIKLYVSHRCEYEKIVYHDRAGIPYMELSAQQAMAYQPDRPLSPMATHWIERWSAPGVGRRCTSLRNITLPMSPARFPQLQKSVAPT
jgi:hypothetical protein